MARKTAGPTGEPTELTSLRKEIGALVAQGYTPEDAAASLAPRLRRTYQALGGNAVCEGNPEKWVYFRRVLIAISYPNVYAVGAQGMSLEEALLVEEAPSPSDKE